jgi:hypothetical protein
MTTPQEAADALDTCVRRTLAACEEEGMAAKDAGELIRDVIFSAWWDWDYVPTRKPKS